MIRHATIAKLLILIRRATRGGAGVWPQWQQPASVPVLVMTARSFDAAQRKSARDRCQDGGGT